MIAGLACVFLMLNSVSCATMFGNNNRTVRVKTNVDKAAVKVNGDSYGYAPAEIEVGGTDIYNSQVVTVEKKGYMSVSRQVKTSFQVVTILNIFNGFIGFIIDGVTGNMMRVNSREIDVPIEKK